MMNHRRHLALATALLIGGIASAPAQELEKDESRRREVRSAREQLSKQSRVRSLREVAGAITRAREHSEGLTERPRANADPNRPLSGPVEIDAPNTATLIDKQPVLRTFGSTGKWIEVAAKGPMRAATLRFRLTGEETKPLETDTIVVARWDSGTRHYALVPQSGYNKSLGYAFARVTRPGLYTAIGLPRDPKVRATLGTIGAMQNASLLIGEGYTPGICGLILCVPDAGGGAPAPGGICDLCLGIAQFPGGFAQIPELQIPPQCGICVPPPVLPRPCNQWVSMGPTNVPGRIHALAVDPKDGSTLYAGSAAGGVFKSTDAGSNWSPQWERQLSLAIGGLAVAPSNRNIVYAATGEWDYFTNAIYASYPGYGVYRSSDGGTTWKRLTPIPSLQTAAVAIDPGKPDRVFIAGERSLHRSTNGGSTWDTTAGNTQGIFDGVISDVVVDPNNADRIFAGVQHSNVRAGGVYRSTDGGNTFQLLSTGIPTGSSVDGPKIALGLKGTHGTDFVAVKMSDQIFTSIDGGNTFTQKTNPGFTPMQGGVRGLIAVDPTDEGVIFGGDVHLFRTANGGNSWVDLMAAATTRREQVHDDVHALIFDPADHNKVFVATDGGVYKSINNGQNWGALHGAGGVPADPFRDNGLTTLQCWTVAVTQDPNVIVAVTSHDNYTYSEYSGTQFTYLNYLNRGEGGWVEYDPKNSSVIYSDNWYSNIVKTTDGNDWWQNQVWTSQAINTSNLNAKPFSIAWNNTNLLLTIEAATGKVFHSSNGGTNWTSVLSVPNVEFTAVAYAPSDDNHAYAATSSGRVWHSTDSGVTWTELARAGLPNQRIHAIAVDWDDPLRLFLALGTRGALGGVGFRQLWRGAVGVAAAATWFDVSGALPSLSLPDLGLSGVALDPKLDDTLYVSNIIGVFRSVDGGDSWAPFSEGLPNTFISHLVIRKRDRTLYVSTMGRGVYRRELQ